MYIAFLFASAYKSKLKPYLGFKFRQVKIPLFHLISVSNSLPHFFGGGIQCSFNYKWFSFHFLFGFLMGWFLIGVVSSSARKFSSASSFFVQKTRYCSIHCDTSLSCCSLASQYRSRPCCFIVINPHWVNICLLYTSDAADDLLCVDLGG